VLELPLLERPVIFSFYPVEYLINSVMVEDRFLLKP